MCPPMLTSMYVYIMRFLSAKVFDVSPCFQQDEANSKSTLSEYCKEIMSKLGNTNVYSMLRILATYSIKQNIV